MFASATKAFSELATPQFRSVLLKSLGLTLALLAVFFVGIQAVLASLMVLPGWLETLIQIVGGFGLIIGSVFLVAPITSLIAALYLDDIATFVEERHYAHDPPGQELAIPQAIALSLKFGLVVIGVNIGVLLLLLLPGVNVLAFLIANGYLLGREYFELVALRHMPMDQVIALRQANRGRVLLSGLLVAGMVSVPLLNLLTPLFATALMVHTFKDVTREMRANVPKADLAA